MYRSAIYILARYIALRYISVQYIAVKNLIYRAKENVVTVQTRVFSEPEIPYDIVVVTGFAIFRILNGMRRIGE